MKFEVGSRYPLKDGVHVALITAVISDPIFRPFTSEYLTGIVIEPVIGKVVKAGLWSATDGNRWVGPSLESLSLTPVVSEGQALFDAALSYNQNLIRVIAKTDAHYPARHDAISVIAKCNREQAGKIMEYLNG